MYRKLLRSKITAAALIAVVLLLGLVAFRQPILHRVIETAVDHRLTNSTVTNLPDGLHVGLCGAGSQLLVDPKRSEPCVFVLVGKNLFIVDAGNKSTQLIESMGFGAGEVKVVLLTGTNSYRINGLGQLLNWNWMLSRNDEPTPVFGPEGVADIVAGLQQAYITDSSYKISQLGTNALKSKGFGGRSITVKFTSPSELLTIIKSPDLEVQAFPKDRFPDDPGLGYVFRYKGRSVLISGDTTKSANVLRHAKGVDLLVHDALSPTLMGFYIDGAARSGMTNVVEIFTKMVSQHATPEDAALTATDAGAKYLLLTGITPPLQLPGAEGIFLGDAAKQFKGPIRIGEDGDMISMPANGTGINRSSIISRF